MIVDQERLGINSEADLEINLEVIGDQKFPLLVLDNLYRDPEYVREVALSVESEPPNSSHPGVKSKLKTDIAALHEIVWKYVGNKLGFTLENSIERSVFPGFSFMRINRAPEDLTIHQCRPHADPVKIAGVVFLNLPDQCAGGTAFYRHRATGAEECILPRKNADRFDQAFVMKAKELGAFQSYENYCRSMFKMPYLEFVKSILTTIPRVKDYTTDSDEDWEVTRKIDMKFNRFIAYPGFMIHSGYYRKEWFGEEMESQRLTQNVFLR